MIINAEKQTKTVAYKWKKHT